MQGSNLKESFPFISFEGIDFSGKSTQLRMLAAKLSTRVPVITLRDPGGSSISEKIRQILLDPDHASLSDRTEILLYEAARAQLTAEKILPALQSGTFVLIDRYYDSTTAYQGYGRGLPLDMIHRLNHFASHDVKPAITFLIDISIETFIERGKSSAKDRLENNAPEFFTRVRNGYLEIWKKEPERVIRIDGENSIEKIHQIIWETVRKKFSKFLEDR